MTSSSSKIQRVYMVVAILSGTLAATLIWRTLHPAASMSDLQAQRLGYASAGDMQDTERFLTITAKGGPLGPGDFKTAHDVLLHGSRTRRAAVVAGLGQLKGAEQHRQAIAELDDVEIEPTRKPLWLGTFRSWVQYQHDDGALTLLLASKNPSVVSLAKELEGAP